MVEHPIESCMERISIGISRVAMFLIACFVVFMAFEVVMCCVFESATYGVKEMSLWTAGAVYLVAGV